MATKVARLQITRSIEQGDLNPVGMIVQSMLTEAQFQALNGTSWVLADGRSVAGSSYATVTGSANVPDARGLFLRAAGTQTVGSETYSATLGLKQNDATARNGLGVSDPGHSHYTSLLRADDDINTGNPDYALTDGDNNVGYGNYWTNGVGTGVSLTVGDAETRPANLAVNVFIKIN